MGDQDDGSFAELTRYEITVNVGPVITTPEFLREVGELLVAVQDVAKQYPHIAATVRFDHERVSDPPG